MPNSHSRSKVSKRSRPLRHSRTTTSPSSAAIVRVAPLPEKPWELNNEQVTLLKNYLKIADASDLELKACLEVARRYRLDPFKQGQIWFIKRWDKNAVSAKGSKGGYIYTPQTGIYGLLHIAGRDYPDFGSMSEPEFGPMFTHDVEGHKFKAPEWCRVKAFKKGISEPTVATIYFEEFCPAMWDNARLFWAKMPRAQIEKCAKARALRTAYPDLGGLYIPEESARFAEDYTESGRQITAGVPSGGSHEAAQAVAERIIEEAKAPKPPEAKKTQDAPKAPHPDPSWPTITIDWRASLSAPVVTGDADLFKPLFDAHCKWGSDGFYHCDQRGALAIESLAASMRFRLEQLQPKSSPPREKDGAVRGKATPAGAQTQTAPSTTPRKESVTSKPAGAAPSESAHGAEPVLVSGTIEAVALKGARVDVKLKMATSSVWMSAWDKAHHEYLTNKGAQCELFVVKREKGDKVFVNIVALKRIGVTEFDENSKPILRTDREAGARTLFP